MKIHCLICGKERLVVPSVIKNGDGKFCSRKCVGKWREKHSNNEKNPNWKGGITPLVTKIRNSDKYIQWRTDVFVRDSFTCQIVGKLVAH